MLRTLMVAALAGYVSAQLSCECQYALATLTANPEVAACLSPDVFIPALTPGLPDVKNAQNTSAPSTMDAWLTNMCAATPCSQETFSAVVRNITAGCSGDHGVPESLLDILQDVQPVYTTVRKMLCLKNADTCTYCATQTLRTLLGNTDSMDLSSCAISHWLSNIGTIVKTLKAYTQIRPRAVRLASRTASRKHQLIVHAEVASAMHHSTRFGPYGLPMDSNASCTTCVKEAAAIINEDFPDAVDCLFPGMKGVCEADSKNSSDGTQTMSTPSTSTQSSPLSTSTLPSPTQLVGRGTNPSPRSSAVQLSTIPASGAFCALSLIATIMIFLV